MGLTISLAPKGEISVPSGAWGGIDMTTKRTYRLIPRKDGSAYDVEVTEPGSASRIVNTFNAEAEAWEWINEQRHVERYVRRIARNPDGRGRPD